MIVYLKQAQRPLKKPFWALNMIGQAQEQDPSSSGSNIRSSGLYFP
jgi:hypothetical protein